MIPHVWMVWCKRTAKCRWCEQQITTATPMVVVKYWRKGNENERKWNLFLYFHPDCWVANGLDYLERNPYTVSVNRGRPKLSLSVEDKRKRTLLVMRKAALEQQKRKLKVDYPDKLLAMARIDEKMMEIFMDITKYGGVPKSWVRVIENT